LSWNDRFINPCGLITRGAVFDPITMTVATLAGGALSAAGTIMGGNAAADAGRRSQEAANFRATQEDMAAQESRASAQRVALDKGRETTLLESKLQARAAAGGGSASDPGVLDLTGDIAGRGEYESLMAMFTGENKARGLTDEATGSRLTGEAAAAEGAAKQSASYLSAAGTIVGSAGSAYRTYNRIPDPRYG
jgi:hypothetical protein